ncbi:MAG: CDP-alcohol phosphatidyltransferase family protein [Alphaproteobacteria bacterium]
MSHNTWIHRAVRVAVRPFVATRIAPNHVTAVRLVTGIVAAGAFAHGDEVWRYWGAGIFIFSLFLDRADGELARLSGKTSPRGHIYDLVSDAVSNALAFLGLGIGLRDGLFGVWAPFMGFAAGAAIAAILVLIVRLEDLHGARAGELGGLGGFDPDDALVVIPIVVWFGGADWLLLAAAVGAPGFAILMMAKFRSRLRGAGS